MKKLLKSTFIIAFLFFFITSCKKEEIKITTTCTTFELGGKQYETVQIGDQCWMAENLDYDAGAGCWEGPGGQHIEHYGRYYTWEVAKRICPDGWHLPTRNDWEKMMQFISDHNGGYERKDYSDGSFVWRGIAVHLKTNKEWVIEKGTNDYGFSALPAGYRTVDHSTGDVVYEDYNYIAMWLSSSNDGASACHCFVSYHDQDFTYYKTPAHLINNGLSVRYVKD